VYCLDKLAAHPGVGLLPPAAVIAGSALLAAAGLLDGLKATSNKVAFDTFIRPLRPQVQWVRQARWVHDGMFVTSSGVTAGTDMALYVVKTVVGQAAAAAAASRLEYIPQTDAEGDPFADSRFVPIV
jgi:transcriptional regulator GlxA family with amidase domain